eukprot:4618009-Karenia_brevis.AAC.1
MRLPVFITLLPMTHRARDRHKSCANKNTIEPTCMLFQHDDKSKACIDIAQSISHHSTSHPYNAVISRSVISQTGYTFQIDVRLRPPF